jgi:hypothetical protein
LKECFQHGVCVVSWRDHVSTINCIRTFDDRVKASVRNKLQYKTALFNFGQYNSFSDYLGRNLFEEHNAIVYSI